MITGASGFLGRHLLAHFLDAGREVIALTRNPLLLDDFAHPRLRVTGTSYGASLANELPRGCAVIHLAAQRNMPSRRASAFTAANVALAEDVARAALAKEVRRFVAISTSLVLGSSEEERDANAPLDDRVGGAYVRSRVAGLVALERVEGLPLVTVLPSIIYGPDHPRARNRMTNYMRQLLRTPVRVAIGGGGARRNLVYVDDVTRSIAAAEASTLSGRQLVSGANVTQDGLERTVREQPGVRVIVPRVAALAAARTIDATLRIDASSGWASRMRTLLAPWCVAPYRTLDGTATPFDAGVRATIEAIRGEAR